jgi:hypothetical protein
MSKLQNDGYKTETNKDLNNYYNNVFRPAVEKMADYKIKTYEIENFIIQCESHNIVERDGWKLKSLQIIGMEYTITVFTKKGFKKGISLKVNSSNNKEEANKIFKERKEQCENKTIWKELTEGELNFWNDTYIMFNI